jgi:nucleoside-diphosphate-sugar epimerase
MARTAFIVGGSGQIGQATARRLLAAGWEVTAAQTRPEGVPADLIAAGVTAVALDRKAPGALPAALAGGADALIDTVAFDAGDGRQLLEIEPHVGALVVISSGSVYCDDQGRTLDEAGETGFPRFPPRIGEDQRTVAPSEATYSTRKRALEETLLAGARGPLAILRPCAIHGPGSRHPREWFFVKRILDGRRVVPLAFGGESRFHTSATANIAQLILRCLEARGAHVLNAADPDPPTVREIGALIAAHYASAIQLAAFPGPPKGPVGSHPWCVARPLVVDMTRALALGYRPVTTYAEALGAACAAAEAAAGAGIALPAYFESLFDYAAEDAFLEAASML